MGQLIYAGGSGISVMTAERVTARQRDRRGAEAGNSWEQSQTWKRPGQGKGGKAGPK